MQLKKEIKKLKTIQKKLNGGNHKHTDLAGEVSEVLASFRNQELNYYVGYSNINNLVHVPTYQDMAKRNQNKAVSDLRELIHELSAKEINKKRCNVLLTKLIETEIYTSTVKKHLSNWKPKQGVKNLYQQYFTLERV